jgi:hypothetical protein
MSEEKRDPPAEAPPSTSTSESVGSNNHVNVGDNEKVVHVGEQQPDDSKKKIRPDREATFKDYLRVFTYATKWDFLAYAAGIIAAIGAGVTLPLMNVIMGRFVGNFSSFVTGNMQQSISEFRRTLDQLA